MLFLYNSILHHNKTQIYCSYRQHPMAILLKIFEREILDGLIKKSFRIVRVKQNVRDYAHFKENGRKKRFKKMINIDTSIHLSLNK